MKIEIALFKGATNEVGRNQYAAGEFVIAGVKTADLKLNLAELCAPARLAEVSLGRENRVCAQRAVRQQDPAGPGERVGEPNAGHGRRSTADGQARGSA